MNRLVDSMVMAAAKRFNAAIVIPARNEEGCLGKMLGTCMYAKRQGLVKRVIVVNDASRDKTAQIAAKAGAEVISYKRRKGKGRAFLDGLRRCREIGAEILITLDADLLNLEIGHIRELLERVSGKGIKMAIMRVHERGMSRITSVESGQRAVKVDAFRFLFMKGKRGKYTKPARRFMEITTPVYGLELALERGVTSLNKKTVLFFTPKKRLRARAPAAIDPFLQYRSVEKAIQPTSKRFWQLYWARERRQKRSAMATQAAKARRRKK